MATDTLDIIEPRIRKRVDADLVIRRLTELVSGMHPGDKVPTHTELMRMFDAPERAVLKALDTLHRANKIVRVNGRGTFVADRIQSGAVESSVSLTTADTSTIVAISRPDHSFFDRCLQVLFQHLEEEGLHLVCRLIDPKPQTTFALPSISDRPLGFIVFRHDLTPLSEQLQADGNRVVMIGLQPEGSVTDVPTVHGDHETGGYLAGSHLFQLGHEHFAITSEFGRDARWRGVMRAIRETERTGKTIRTTTFDAQILDSWRQDPRLAAAYFARPNAPTGIIAWNDHEAAGLLTLLTRAGVRVPEDISLIGYDNLPEAKLVYPALTTVDAGIPQLIRAAVNLVTAPNPPRRSQSVMVLPSLVLRDSTAAPRRHGK